MKDFSICPRCHASTKPATAMNGGESEFWLECTKCNAYINTYIPQPHQSAVHEDAHMYIGNFGGFGSGKTLTSREEVYKHVFLTPNANVLITANVASQYEQTIMRDMLNDLPEVFIEHVSNQKSYWDLINGARIMFRPLDDVDKIRSYNVTMFVIIEASEVDEEAFSTLKSRLRNTAASVPRFDDNGNVVMQQLDNGMQVPEIKEQWLKGIIESNPDAGWIRRELLYISDKIYKHGNVLEDVVVEEKDKDPHTSSHITSTDSNAFLPPGFIEQLTATKPAWWVSRYINGSFSYAEGLVYPSAVNRIVQPFRPPKEWKRIVAADYGLHDDFVYLCGAVDEKNGVVYIYREERTNNKNIEELSKIFYETTEDIPVGGYYTQPILDPKSGSQRDYNKKTLYDHFMDYGIAFQPGAINKDARVFRVNTYLESAKLKIMACCVGLLEEIKDYRFPARTSTTKRGSYYDKPLDGHDHGISALEWICMVLPADPSKLMYGSYDEYGRELSKLKRNTTYGIPQLQDTETQNNNDNIFLF